eukprot:scaffold43800_cov17-Prasinocladus_malaysianus.AAC.1
MTSIRCGNTGKRVEGGRCISCVVLTDRARRRADVGDGGNVKQGGSRCSHHVGVDDDLAEEDNSALEGR